MKAQARRNSGRRLRTFVLDCEALSLAVRGDGKMLDVLSWAVRDDTEVVTSPLTLVEAYDGRSTEQRWDWVLSRIRVADVGKDEARQARRLLADAKLHGHKYAIDAVLAVIARQQRGQVTLFTSDVGDLEMLVPSSVLVRKV